MEKTYIELLAENDFLAREEYDENAKDLLVEHREYEEEIGPVEHHPDELENQDAFKEFGGSHQHASLPPPSKEYKDTTKQSIQHERHMKTHVLNIDSRFRNDPASIATDFTFNLARPIKNVTSIRVSSLEFPNTYYTFSKVRANISFTIGIYLSANNFTNYKINIAEGNYVDPESLISEINSKIAAKIPTTTSIIVSYNSSNGTASFFSSNTRFNLDFEKGDYVNFKARTFDRGLGYSLGFRLVNDSNGTQYTPSSTNNNCSISGTICCYSGKSILSTLDSNYLMLTLNPDWKVVCNYTPDRSQHFSFMKIIMTAPKNGVLYDNGSNTVTKEYHFPQPTNISTFPVRISDEYDQTIDLNGMDFSFSLEIREVLHAELYETMRLMQ